MSKFRYPDMEKYEKKALAELTQRERIAHQLAETAEDRGYNFPPFSRDRAYWFEVARVIRDLPGGTTT